MILCRYTHLTLPLPIGDLSILAELHSIISFTALRVEEAIPLQCTDLYSFILSLKRMPVVGDGPLPPRVRRPRLGKRVEVDFLFSSLSTLGDRLPLSRDDTLGLLGIESPRIATDGGESS